MQKHYSILNIRLFKENRAKYDYVLLRAKLMAAIDGYKAVKITAPDSKGTTIEFEKENNKKILTTYSNNLKKQISNCKRQKTNIAR